jgi:hypothetical protein
VFPRILIAIVLTTTVASAQGGGLYSGMSVSYAKEAVPVAQEMLRTRQVLVNAELGSKPDEVKAALETYSAAAAKMAALEAQAFAKIYALLKPNQQSRAPQAFTLMAGIFVPPAPPAPRPGRGGR